MKKYYIGVDVGTDSVGTACTDEHYNLLRLKGKDAWAVRLFDEAQDAAERRMQRTARRRLQRRRQRIEFLQSIFAPYMTDDRFFLRLNNSGFFEDDKDETLHTRFSLFADETFTDAQFHTLYPTVYHLRNAVMRGEVNDIRLYYLALHHIVKYRGHFLFEGENINAVRDIRRLFETYNLAVAEAELSLSLSAEKAEAFREIAASNRGLNDKKNDVTALFETTSKAMKEMLSLLVGASAKLAVIFDTEEEKSAKLSFRDVTDESFEELNEVYGDERFAVLKAARDIYDFIRFERVLGGKESVSDAMVALYEKHADDLKTLKDFIRKNYPKDVYNQTFRRVSEKGSYVAYVGYTKPRKGKKISVKRCKDEEFYKYLRGVLKTSPVKDETYEYLMKEIENETLLPKILHADNGVFPHQINGMELDVILKRLCDSFPQFAKCGEDGISAAEKIKKIFLFRIPYYVGPLNSSGKNGWCVRKQTGKITPWNFDEKIDRAASNEAFIRRMTNKCTYLHGQDVLPKGSMYYQAFCTLNQINKLRFDGAPISVALKQAIFNNVYLRRKKVGVKQIKEYLSVSGLYTREEAEKLTIGGYDEEVGLQANMSSYVTFKEKYGDLVDREPNMFEDIIFWHTLNTDKSLVEQMILEKYGSNGVVKENIKVLKGLTSFKDFGRLSKKLLCELSGGVDPVTGEVYTVLQQLYRTNHHFNQLLNSENYSFAAAIAEENAGEQKEKITYEDVENRYLSPMVRRGVWQAITMIDEYVTAVGNAPEKIFIEVTRHDGIKKRTLSRKRKLQELYASLSSDCKHVDELRSQLNAATDGNLQQERLYLYFLQLGRCAYTGERIDLDRLSTDLYDVDHIVPQSIVKDDSLDNKVLVKREKNAQKSDVYPLPQGFTDQRDFWRYLTTKSKALMSDSKYARLTRTKPLSDDDFKDFVDRQLVVTNQTVKAVAELLQDVYGAQNTRIVYSKASNVSAFRQKYSLVKCRETNDLHHARDAYLNVVVGNVYDTKFTTAYDYYYRKPNDFWREYNLRHLFDRPVCNAWNGAEDLARVKEIAKKTSMQVTRLSYIKKGSFYSKETIYSAKDCAIASPRKGSFPYIKTKRYGGYNGLSVAYFSVVESTVKEKRVKTFEAIPILADVRTKEDERLFMQYLREEKGLIDPVVKVRRVKIQSLLSINGYRARLAGLSGVQCVLHNAEQWRTDERTDAYLKQAAKYVERMKKEDEAVVAEQKQAEKIPLISSSKGVSAYATREENVTVYEGVITYLSKKRYQGLSALRTFKEKLCNGRKTFAALSVYEQLQVLLQLAQFMRCNAQTADLTLLNDKGRCGSIFIGKNVTDLDVAIIHQSPCGLQERIQRI